MLDLDIFIGFNGGEDFYDSYFHLFKIFFIYLEKKGIVK